MVLSTASSDVAIGLIEFELAFPPPISLSSMNFYCFAIMFFRSIMVLACNYKLSSNWTFYDSKKLFLMTSSR